MNQNLKKRFYTSLILFLVLYFMFISQFVLGYFLIIIGVISILEFIKMNSIIFRKNPFFFNLLNTFFIIYISFFCLTFFISTSFENLKDLIFLILLTCVASDLGGFLFGKILKGPKLTKISPKKTISGAIGSIVLSILFISTFTYLLSNIFTYHIILIGLLISIGSQLGDLLFSFIKRKSLLKDTGKFLPGHGGVIDRIDSILIGIPVGLIGFILIH